MLQEAIRSVPRDLDGNPDLELQGWDSVTTIPMAPRHPQAFPETAAVYSLEDQTTGQVLYIGETLQLNRRMERQFSEGRLSMLYDSSPERAMIRYLPISFDPSRNQGWRTRLLEGSPTLWNV